MQKTNIKQTLLLDSASIEELPHDDVASDELQILGDCRQGERRQSTNRRQGVRGLWESRRLFDRRKREYSIFGKRFDGSDDDETDISKIPDVAHELLVSPAEIRILQEEEQNTDNAAKADQISAAQASLNLKKARRRRTKL